MRFVLEETPAKVGDDRTPPEIWVSCQLSVYLSIYLSIYIYVAMRFVLEETPAKVGDDRTPPEIWVRVNPIYYIIYMKKNIHIYIYIYISIYMPRCDLCLKKHPPKSVTTAHRPKSG